MKRYILGSLILANIALAMDVENDRELFRKYLAKMTPAQLDTLVESYKNGEQITFADISINAHGVKINLPEMVTLIAERQKEIALSMPDTVAELDKLEKAMPTNVALPAPVELPIPLRISAEDLERIEGIRQSAKEALHGQYPQVDIRNPQGAIEKAVAETILLQEKWERDIPTMSKAELQQLAPKVSGWYWSHSWAEKIKLRLAELEKIANATSTNIILPEITIEQMSKEQLKERFSGSMFAPTSETGKRVVERYSQLQQEELKALQLPATALGASEELPAFDQIENMSKPQLMEFQEKLAAQEGKISFYIQSKINERLEALTIHEREHAEWVAFREEEDQAKRPSFGAAVAERAKSPEKRVHFERSSDSDGSGIARPAPTVVQADAPLKSEEFTDSNSKVINTVEGFPARELLTPADASKDPIPRDDSSSSKDSVADSAGATDAKVRQLRDSSGSDSQMPPIPVKDSTPSSSAAPKNTAQDSIAVPVLEGQDPLSVEPIAAPVAPDRKDTTSPGSALEEDARVAERLREQLAKEHAETPGRPETPKLPVKEDTEPIESGAPASGDAKKLTKQLALEHAETPGGPDAPTLPVVSGATPAAGISSVADLKKAAYYVEGKQTPGGPDEKDESEDGSSSKSDSDKDKDPKDSNSYTPTQKALIGIGVATAIYGTTEMVLAYKSITPEEWKTAPGAFNKAKLVLKKTWNGIKSRPSQGAELLKKMASRVNKHK